MANAGACRSTLHFRVPGRQRDEGEDREAAERRTLSDFLGDSLALGAAVTVSSTHAGYAAENSVDGKLGDEEAR